MIRNKCRGTADVNIGNGSRPKAYANPGSVYKTLHTEADNTQYVPKDINPSHIGNYGTRDEKCRGTANDDNDIRSRPKAYANPGSLKKSLHTEADSSQSVTKDIILPLSGVKGHKDCDGETDGIHHTPCSVLWGLQIETDDMQQCEEHEEITPTTTIGALSSILGSGKIYIIRMGRYDDDSHVEEVVSYYYDKRGALEHIFKNLNYRPSDLYSLTYEEYDIRKDSVTFTPVYKKGGIE